jgi:hypothetical protein
MPQIIKIKQGDHMNSKQEEPMNSKQEEPMNVNRSNAGRRRYFILVAFLGISFSFAHAQFAPSAAAGSALSIPLDHLLQPSQLNDLLQRPAHQPPLILQVGSHVLFSQAHIPGSQFIGSTATPAGLELLRNRVASLPKAGFIVLYCGCCPWSHCPNVGPAFKQLRDLGFTNVKVLYMADNFGDDWVAKGYRVEKGQ